MSTPDGGARPPQFRDPFQGPQPVQPAQFQPQPVQPAQPDPYHQGQYPPMGGLAQAKLNVMAIVALCTSWAVFGLPGIILGFISLSQIRRTGERGHGLAVAGVIVGFVCLAGGIVLMILMIILSITAAGAAASVNDQLNQLNQQLQNSGN